MKISQITIKARSQRVSQSINTRSCDITSINSQNLLHYLEFFHDKEINTNDIIILLKSHARTTCIKTTNYIKRKFISHVISVIITSAQGRAGKFSKSSDNTVRAGEKRKWNLWQFILLPVPCKVRTRTPSQ